MKKFIIGALAAATLVTTAQAERVTLLDSATFTMNPEFQTTGPVFKNTPEVRATYGDEVATMLLKNADQLANKYLQYNDPQAYYAFLTMALTVPMHEGFYIHFREIANDPSLCKRGEKTYKGKLSGTTKKMFKKYLLKGKTPLIIKCRKIDDELPTVKQILRASLDGSDLGMMQVSVRWHYDVYLAQKMFQSVDQTIKYGVKFLMKGFEPIYRKANQYPCITKGNTVDYQNLIRGTWGGFYNGGSVKQACRFADYDHLNDRAFKRNLDKVMAFPQTGLLGYNEELALNLSPAVKAAVVEVINNLKYGTDNRSALQNVLK